MRCPSCEHENPDRANFCRSCGLPLYEKLYWRNLRRGITPDEVRKFLGEPLHVVAEEHDEYWFYEEHYPLNFSYIWSKVLAPYHGWLHFAQRDFPAGGFTALYEAKQSADFLLRQ